MKKTAKCAVFHGANQPFTIAEYPVEKAPAGYGASALLASGVCGTDIHIHTGRLGTPSETIIGHEFVGKLFDLDPAEGEKYGLKVGDNVIADIAIPCGECPLCLSGDDANCIHMQCANGTTVDHEPHFFGGYAEVNYTPLSNLVKIPDDLDPRMVCTFACPGPTAIHAFCLAHRANIDIASMRYAVVQGLGPVGMFACLYLCAIGIPHVYAINFGVQEQKENLAKAFGVERIFRLDGTNNDQKIVTELTEITGGLGVDLVFEASGAPAAVPMGLQLLRNRGVYLVPGQYSNHGDVAISPQLITFKALQILGSSQYSMVDVRKYLEFLSAHPELHDKIRALSTGYPVEKVNEAFADAMAGKNIKTMLVPTEE